MNLPSAANILAVALPPDAPTAYSAIMPEIAKRSPTHDALARWILENPGPRLVTRCAEAFGYTVPWMSTIMNSDAFRSHLATLSDSADAAVVADIPAKMRGLAGLALDALADQVDIASRDTSVMPRQFLRETADMVLHRLGFAPEKKGTGTTVVNQTAVFMPVDPAALAAARDRFNSLTAFPPSQAEASPAQHSVPTLERLVVDVPASS